MDHAYYETTIVDKGQYGYITIGLSKTSPETRDGNIPGNFIGSAGYQSNSGRMMADGNVVKAVDKLAVGDTLGCGFYRLIVDGTIFLRFYFTKNGEYLDGSGYLEEGEYYPTIAMMYGGKVQTNFGENKFQFNYQGMQRSTFL